MNKEFEDYGVYNAEYISIEDSRFTNIEGILIDIYRGGTDESTFGPHFIMKGSKLDNIGFGARNKQKAMMRLHGVQVTDINSNELINTQPIKIFHTVGEPITSITSNILDSKNKLQIVELNSAEENTASVKNNKFIN
jgi:poly(beta-D-mannuronate) lyase